MKRLIIAIALLLLVVGLFARTKDGVSSLEMMEYRKATTGLAPTTDYNVHQVGELFLTVSNWGVFGSGRGNNNPRWCDPFLVRQGEDICGLPTGQCLPSGEYPGCSGIEYLFQGCFWFGAVVDGDTMVSVAHDGWFHEQELFPSRLTQDTMMFYSIYDDDPPPKPSNWPPPGESWRGWPEAHDSLPMAEEIYIATYTDTAMDRSFVGENHRPIGISILQKSFAWSYDYAKNFVFLKFYVKNIRQDGRTIDDVYFGVYVDGDVGHIDTPEYAQDDITGFIESYTYFVGGRDTTVHINTAWIADNDGDPVDGRFVETSPTGAMAFKVLFPEELDYSFNWWVSNVDTRYDWGPTLMENYTGWQGTPETDIMKYQLLSNLEKDYDQTRIMEMAYGADSVMWNRPPDRSTAEALRTGYDTRFLISFGPFTLRPSDTEDWKDAPAESLIVAFMVAEDFHIDPSNTGSRWSDERFQKDNIARTAVWVQRIYDNNYRGPQPPPAPEFEVKINPYELVVYWRDNAEDVIDPITELEDFEGYRVYVADWNHERYYTPLAEYDLINYYRYDRFFQTPVGGIIPSFTDDLYDVDTAYTVGIYHQGSDIHIRDTSFAGFIPMSLNRGLPPTTILEESVGRLSAGEEVYYHRIRDLRPGADRFVVVTSFDSGKLSEGLKSLESSKRNHARWVVPIGDGSKIQGIYVWPNPYRVDGNYHGRSGLWAEGSPTSVWTEYARELHFVNLPSRCTIRIFTLDGDVVAQIEHDDDAHGALQGGATWNMINRNDQSIVSGIYLYSVEDHTTGENTTGKFVVIK